MASNIAISKNQRDKIKIILTKLGKSQNQLASKAEYKPNSLSDFLNGKSEKIRDTTWDKILKALRKMLDTKKESNANLSLINEVNELLLELELGIEKLKTSPPGRIIRPDSVNYIDRDVDSSLKKLLNNIFSDFVLVKGGPLCGKTTVLKRFITENKDKTNFVYLDFHNIFIETTADFSGVQAIAKIFNSLYASITNNEYPDNDQMSSEEFLKELKTFLSEQNEPSKQYVIIFDHLDYLYENVFENDTDEADRIINLLAHWYFKMDEEPLDKIKVIISMSVRSYSAKASDILRTQSTIFQVDDFNMEQVEKLCKIYGIGSDMAKKVYDFYKGQVYLTHTAIDNLSSGTNWNQIKSNLSRTEKYLHRLSKIENVISNRFDNINIIEIYKSILEGKITEVDYKVIDILEMVGILYNGKMKSEFVRNYINNKLRK